MANESTQDKLCGMRLSVMARTYRDQDLDPRTHDMTFDERFAQIVDAEWDARRSNKRVRLIRSAGFSCPEANIADVRYDPDRKLERSKISELANCSWIRNAQNLIITGASGSGKTWLACALGVAACSAFFDVRYIRMPQMLDELCASKDEAWLKAKKRYQSCDLLIIDDWLLEPLEAKEAREVLEIVEARYKRGSMILCSQFSPAGWHKKIGDGPLADSVVDRIAYNAYSIHIEGNESMRKRIDGMRL